MTIMQRGAAKEIEMVRVELTDSEYSSLSNALFVAAERYEDNALELRKSAARPDVTEGAKHHYTQLAEIFERQATDTRALMAKIDDAEGA